MDKSKDANTRKILWAVLIAVVLIAVCLILLLNQNNGPVDGSEPTTDGTGAPTTQTPTTEAQVPTTAETTVPETTVGLELPQYSVVFTDYNGRVLSQETYVEGDKIKEPADVTKQIKWGKYTYQFAGWNAGYTGVAVESIVYKPVYERVVTLFEDDFTGDIPGENPDQAGWLFTEGENGAAVDIELLGSNEVLYIHRDTASANGEDKATPRAIIEGVTIPKDAQKLVIEFDVRTDEGMRAAFSSYKPSNSLITKVKSEGAWSHVTITVDIPSGSFVSFVNGTEKESGVLEGENALKLGEKQQFRFTAGNVYDAAGIYIDNVVLQVRYTADLSGKEPAVYDLSFLDIDEKTVCTMQLEDGEYLTAPEKPDDPKSDAYTYAFLGWQEVGSETLLKAGDAFTATQNAVYKAVYDVTPITYYTVVFKDLNGTELSKSVYRSGTEIEAPKNVAQTVKWGYYTYTFAGWSPDFSGKAEADATYVPVYTRSDILFKDDFTSDKDGSDPAQSGWAVKEGNNSAAVDVKAYSGNNALCIYRTEAYAGTEEYVAKYNGATPSASVNVTIPENANALIVEFDVLTSDSLKANFSSREPDHAFISNVKTLGEWSHVKVRIDLDTGYVSYLEGDEANAGTFTAQTLLKTGEAQEFRFTAGYIKDAEGVYIDNVSFTAEYALDTNAPSYTIEFQNHTGTTVSKQTYIEGDPVQIPGTISSEIKWGAYIYKLAGWNRPISETAAENAVYKPVYERTDVLFSDDFTDDTAGSDPTQNGWAVKEGNNNAAVDVKALTGNNALHIYRTEAYAGTEEYVSKYNGATPSVSINVVIPENADSLTVEFDVMTTGVLKANFSSREPENTFISNVKSDDEWSHVKIVIDLDTGYVSYLGGEEINAATFTAETLLKQGEAQEFRFTAGYIKDAEGIFIDNVTFTAGYIADTDSAEPKVYTVTFKDIEGQTVDAVEVEDGCVLSAVPNAPEVAADATHEYLFIGWRTEDGERVDTAATINKSVIWQAEYLAVEKNDAVKNDFFITYADDLTLDQTGTPIAFDRLHAAINDLNEVAEVINAEEGREALITVVDDAEERGKVIKVGVGSAHTYSSNTNAGFYRELDMTGLSNLIIEFKVKTEGSRNDRANSAGFMQYIDGDQWKNVTTQPLWDSLADAKVWTDVKVVLTRNGDDTWNSAFFRDGIRVNGIGIANQSITNESSVRIYFRSGVRSGYAVYYDNIRVYEAATLPTTYSVSFEYTGAEGEVTDTKVYLAGTEIILPTDEPAKDRHSFVGWVNEADPTDVLAKDAANVSATKNVVYAPIFREDPKATLAFYDDSGAQVTADGYTGSYYVGDTVVAPVAPADVSGKVFMGWKLYDPQEQTYLSDSLIEAGSDITVTENGAAYKAVYKNLYTITFMDHTGTPISAYSRSVMENTLIAIPMGPTRAADDSFEYVFTGWKLVESGICGQNLTAGTLSTGNATYKAVYVAVDKVADRTVLFTTGADDIVTDANSKPVAADFSTAKINDFTQISENIDTETGNGAVVRYENGVIKAYDNVGLDSKTVAGLYRELNVSGLTNLTIEFKVETVAGKNGYYAVYLQHEKNSSDQWKTGDDISIETYGVTTQTSVRIELVKDPESGTWTATEYKGDSDEGTETASGITIGDTCRIYFLSRVRNNGYVYWDDIKVYTTSTPSYHIQFLDHAGNSIEGDAYNLTVKEGSAITVPAGPARTDAGTEANTYRYEFAGWKVYANGTVGGAIGENPTATADASYIATYHKVLFETDCQSLTVGEAVSEGSGIDGWSTISTNDTKKLYVQGANDPVSPENIALHVFKDTTGNANDSGEPRAIRNVDVAGLSKVTLTLKINTDGTPAVVYFKNGSNTVTVWNDETDGWQTVKIELLISENQLTVYLDGEQSGDPVTLDGTEFKFYFAISAKKANPGEGVYYDDIKIYGQ